MTLLWMVALLSRIHFGQTTTYSAVGDRFNPHPRLGCIGRRMRDDTDMTVASRDLPCHAPITLCVPEKRRGGRLLRRARCVRARVEDRGPYGRYKVGSMKGRHKSELDLAPAPARALRHDGFELAVWIED